MRPRDAALPTCRCLGPGASWKRGITKKKHQHMRGMPRSHSRGGARPARAHRPVHRSRWNRLSSVCASQGALCQQLGSQQVLWLNPNSHRAAPQTFPRGRLLAEIKSGHFLEGNRPYRSPDIQAHCYEKQNFQSKEQMWKSSPGSSCVPADGPGFKALPKCSQRKRTWQHLGQNSQWQPLCLWHTSSLLS